MNRETYMVLQNGLALSTQDKLRMQQSFEIHEDAIQWTSITRKQKSHSTSSEKQTWNKENVEKDLRDWPVGTDLPKPLVSTQRLWMEGSECTRTWRVRMPGGEICVPTHLNSTKIRSFYSCYQPRVDLNGENVRWWRAWLLKRLVS